MTISVCMMVKIATDEDVRLMRGAVNSIAYIADELCIVDTFPDGKLSEALYPVTDDGEIIMGQASLGPKTRIKNSPWRADFAYHRNESIEMATGDWVLILDHDEEFVCGNVPELRRFLEGIDVDRVQVQVNNLDAGGHLMHPFNQVRFIRAGTAHFEGYAHHQLAPEAVGVHYGDAHINHYGYGLSRAAMDAKRKRTLDILQAWQKDEPDNPQIDYWLAKSYSSMKDNERAIEHIERYLSRTHDLETDKIRKSAFWLAANHLLMVGREEAAARWVREGLERMPGNQDLLFMKAELAVAAGNWDECLDYSTRFIERYSALNGKPDPKDPFDCYTLKPECISHSLQRVAHISLYKGLHALGVGLSFLHELPEDKSRQLIDDAKVMIAKVLQDTKGLLETLQKESKEAPYLWVPPSKNQITA